MLILLPICNFSYAQYFAKVTNGESYAKLNVNISDNVYMQDLGIEISENVYIEDFTIGFTSSKTDADVFISDSYTPDFEVNIKNSYADIDIEASDNVYMEDIGIEIKKSGYVNYLVYNDMDFLSIEVLVCALLPIINLHLDDNKKIEKIPIYKSQSSQLKSSNGPSSVSPYVESQIVGDFEGWDGDTIFKLMNGEVWQQSSYDYIYHYDYNPIIKIFETQNGYIMKVANLDKTVSVKRIE